MVSLSKYRKSKRKTATGDLTSLIDVIFLLLIFFLLTSVTSTPISKDRVEASIEGNSIEVAEVLTIEVTSSRTYVVNSFSYTLDELYRYFENEKISKERNIAITSSRGALYSDVLSAISPLVEMGWSNISFVVE